MRTLPQYTDNDIDEDMKLTRQDYVKILHHYHRDSRHRAYSGISTKTIKERAQNILAEKLCRCIKSSVKTRARKSGNLSDESPRRIAYCSRSIFRNKNLRHHGFRCKTKRTNKLRPRLMHDITKTAKNVNVNP